MKSKWLAFISCRDCEVHVVGHDGRHLMMGVVLTTDASKYNIR
jgi:hypothetical protein